MGHSFPQRFEDGPESATRFTVTLVSYTLLLGQNRKERLGPLVCFSLCLSTLDDPHHLTSVYTGHLTVRSGRPLRRSRSQVVPGPESPDLSPLSEEKTVLPIVKSTTDGGSTTIYRPLPEL